MDGTIKKTKINLAIVTLDFSCRLAEVSCCLLHCNCRETCRVVLFLWKYIHWFKSLNDQPPRGKKAAAAPFPQQRAGASKKAKVCSPSSLYYSSFPLTSQIESGIPLPGLIYWFGHPYSRIPSSRSVPATSVSVKIFSREETFHAWWNGRSMFFSSAARRSSTSAWRSLLRSLSFKTSSIRT